MNIEQFNKYSIRRYFINELKNNYILNDVIKEYNLSKLTTHNFNLSFDEFNEIVKKYNLIIIDPDLESKNDIILNNFILSYDYKHNKLNFILIKSIDKELEDIFYKLRDLDDKNKDYKDNILMIYKNMKIKNYIIINISYSNIFVYNTITKHKHNIKPLLFLEYLIYDNMSF